MNTVAIIVVCYNILVVAVMLTLTHMPYTCTKQVCLRPGPAIDPDHRDTITTPYSTEKVSRFIKTFFKGVAFTPSIYEACILTVCTYTCTYNLVPRPYSQLFNDACDAFVERTGEPGDEAVYLADTHVYHKYY